MIIEVGTKKRCKLTKGTLGSLKALISRIENFLRSPSLWNTLISRRLR